MSETLEFALSQENFEAYLLAGGWSPEADDNITDEVVSADLIQRLVRGYNEVPTSESAIQGLGLMALLLGVAEWGVDGTDLPDDPAEKNWDSDSGEISGKHLMSYAVGGVGIMHADRGSLENYIEWVADSDVVPESEKPALMRLTKIKYRKDGILYDEVRAAGRCKSSTRGDDLLGEPFKHFRGRAGSKYCGKYRNKALTPKDWQVFRTWIRASLRTKEAQRYLLALWLLKYWQPTIAKVPGGDGAAEEMLVNARVRNSLPGAADDAIKRNPPLPGVAGRVQRQLDQYEQKARARARRRWRIMMRPVVLYRHYSGLPQLTGIHL